MPKEYLYFKKPSPRFFSQIYTDEHGTPYYGFFYQHYERLDPSLEVYKIIKEETVGLPSFSINNVYCPKYLVLLSRKPFLISFKNILEELHKQSKPESTKAIKVEKILKCLLFKCFMPKYTSTQMTFTLGTKYYRFFNNSFHSEVSLKLILRLFTPINIVIILLGMLTGSLLIVEHSKWKYKQHRISRARAANVSQPPLPIPQFLQHILQHHQGSHRHNWQSSRKHHNNCQQNGISRYKLDPPKVQGICRTLTSRTTILLSTWTRT